MPPIGSVNREVIVTTATSINDIGTRIASRLSKLLGKRRFAMWFDQGARFQLDGGDLRVTVANKFLADGIARQFMPQVNQAALEELGHAVCLSLVVGPTRPAPGGDALTPTSGGGTQTSRDKPELSPRRAALSTKPSRKRWRKSLDEFVVGPCNELAFAAAARLAGEDIEPGSPLFIHGDCGLGKTHLLQGICRRASERNSQKRIRYTTGEQFTNEYITAVRHRELDTFRRKIRRLDLLAVDDIHFIASKEKTQQEFLHSFNEIELSGARVVMASDSHPKLIKQFSDALSSRCVRGMVVRMDTPDPQTRLRIVEALAERRGLAVPQSASQAISQRCAGSVRDIEGLLNKLQALSMIDRHAQRSLHGQQPVGLSMIDRLFHDQPAQAPSRPVRYDAVLDAVCGFFALTPELVTGRVRRSYIVFARSLLIHLTYELTPMSYPEIAFAMGRPNHSTIVTAAQRIKRQLKEDKPLLIPGQPAEVTPSQLHDQLRREIIANA